MGAAADPAPAKERRELTRLGARPEVGAFPRVPASQVVAPFTDEETEEQTS